MNKNTKRIIFFGVVIVAPLCLFIFRDGIFKGKISITGSVPYNVEVIGENSVHCETDPCVITLKAGLKDLLFTKPHHKSKIISTDVNSFRTTDLNVDFEILPRLFKAENIPTVVEVKHQLIIENGVQKLVKVGDQSKRAIVYFPRILEDVKIFSSENRALLLVQDDIFVIDTIKSTRNKLATTLNEIEGGKWSKSGNFFAFKEKNRGDIFLLDIKDSLIKPLKIKSDLSQISWSSDDRLFFATNQSYSDMVNEINILHETGLEILFATYHPDLDKYSKLGVFEEVTAEPENVVVSASGSELYFNIGLDKYKIVSGKF